MKVERKLLKCNFGTDNLGCLNYKILETETFNTTQMGKETQSVQLKQKEW